MGQNVQAVLVVIAQDVRHVYEYVTDKSVLTEISAQIIGIGWNRIVAKFDWSGAAFSSPVFVN